MVHVERWREMEGGRAFYNGEAGGRLSATVPPSWDVAASLGTRRIPISVIQGDQDYVDPSATAWTAFPTSSVEARGTRALTVPSAGLYASLKRPLVPSTSRPPTWCFRVSITMPRWFFSGLESR